LTSVAVDLGAEPSVKEVVLKRTKEAVGSTWKSGQCKRTREVSNASDSHAGE
jgi:hypothetical protein